MPQWNQLQLQIAALFQQGLTIPQIVEMGYKQRTVYKVQDLLAKAKTLPDLSEAAIAAAPPPKKFGQKKGELTPSSMGGKPGDPAPKTLVFTNDTSQATGLRMIPKVQQLPLTPGMFVSYMCAVARGFQGDLGDFLDLAAMDFWTGREVNPFQVISGYAEAVEAQGGG